MAIEVVPFTNTVKVINREITVSVGSTSVSVNVGDCATVSSVANAIEDAIKENVSLEGNDISVSVVGKNIVFTSNNDVKITCDALGRSEEKLTDFVVKSSDTPIEIDFESDVGTIDDNTTIGSVIGKINEKLKDCDLSICYNEEGADDKYLDHLELVGDNPFSIENIGTSIILKQLGFSDAVAVKGADGKYRIFGSALSGMDFSKAFSLKGVSVYANMNLSLGTQIEELKNNISFVDNETKNELKLEFTDTNVRNYNVGGFLEVGDKHYRITDVQNGYIAVSRTSYEGEELSDETPKSSDFWKNATYVASASASLGFVGMDVFASGKIGLNANFELEKTDDPEDDNFFGFKIKDTSKINVTAGETEVIAGEIDEPTGETEGDAGGAEDETPKMFELNAYADVFGSATKLATGEIAVISENKSLRVSPEFVVTDGYKEIVDQFKNFSVEQLLAVLDGLVTRLASITEKTDVKIPVINKSVSDLVDVTKDLQKVIAEMRQQKVTSVQQFVNYMNKHLVDSNFSNEDGDLIKLRYENGNLLFDFNIVKAFSVRHRFDFGSSAMGINGNTNLNVDGKFWFTLSAKLLTNGEFDLLIDCTSEDAKGLEFGAEVEIVGDGIRFDLGICGAEGENEGLLKNLIKVGENGDNAFVYGKACLKGSLGKNSDISLKNFDASTLEPEFRFPIAVYGKLPITVLDVSMGDIILGKWNGTGVHFDKGNVSECRADVDLALNALFNNSENEADYAGLYVLDKKEIPSFQLILDKEPKSGETPFVADLSSVRQGIIDLANGNVSWFDKIKLGITALNTLFETLEAGINTNLGKTITSVPVVGPTLGAGVDFLSVLKDKVLEPFSNFVYESSGLTVEMVAEKMNDLFDAYFRENAALLDSLLLPEGDSESEISEWKRVGGAGTWYRSTNNSAEWFFQLGGSYDWGTSLGLDFGFPGLGLKADGGLDLKLDWSLDFGFGISETDGFYFIFNEGNEINVTASAELNADINGALAGLGLSLQTQGGDNHAAVGLGFGLNLADFDEGKVLGKLELKGSELERLKVSNDLSLSGSDEKTLDRGIGKVAFSSALSKLEFSYAASVDVFASMLVGFGRDVEHPNTPAKFPNISGAFEFVWSKTNGSSGDGLTTLGFSNLSLDLGSFIDGVLGPIVSKIQKVVEPMEPLIDFLTTPFPVLKDVGISITPLELAKKYGGGNFDDSMIKAINSLISMTKQISAMKKNGLNIDLGDFMLVGGDGDEFKAKSFLEGSSSSKSLDSSLSTYAKKLEKSSEITAQASNALGGQGLNVGEGGWDFIWNHPTDIFKMLMGQDIDLVYYDMPKLSFNFDWDTFVSIWGPLGARLGVTFSASIDLSFGYDTLGIHQWIESDRKDYGSLVNGFYVGDRDKDGNDINELSFYGGLTAAAEINAGVKAGVGGGVGINVAFDLFDPNKDGKIRLNEMSQIVKADGLQGLFEISGKITAKLYAYVDLWLTKKKWNITGDITLFSFELTRNTSPILVSKNENGDVIAHVGDNSSSRLYTDDKNISLEDGDEILDLTLDKNSVGSLDIESGKTFFINSKEGVDKLTLSSDVPVEYNLEIRGGEGDDVIDLSGLKIADGYYVVIWGGAGNDRIKAAEGLNIIFGDDGVYTPLDKDDKEKDKGAKLDDGDRFVVEGKFNAGVSGDDIILGNKGSQVIIGGVGSDKIRGKEGDNIILGDAGHVEFVVNDNGSIDMESVSTARTDTDLDGGNDYLFGGAGVDYIVGGAGSDFIDGEEGSDTIKGERGDDYIFGGLGDDTIGGGSGSDIIFGDGFWSDSFDVSKSFDLDVFNDDFKKAHEGKFDGGLSLKRWLDLDDDGFDFLDIEKEISEPENIPEYGEDTINGDEGDDLIFGDAGDKEGKKDTIKGGIGNDVIDGDGGGDIISGGIDNDVIYGGSGSDIIDGGAGNDTIYGDDGAKVYTTNEEVFEKDPVVFGENFGLNEKIYKDAKSTSEGAGDDVITSGLGMDFVDGQEGNDTVIVNLSGGHDVNYTNVIDSGDENENNVLTIEGTELDDKLLMRMNNDKSLGFVALLPEGNNKNIERVNFNKGINEVNLNANGGNDSITIDGTAKSTNVDAGAGNDTIRVGQLYNADMGEANATTNVKNDDLFNTVAVNTDHGVKYLSDGVSAGSTLNIEGAAGDDTFALLHNAGEELKVSGGNGNDGFSMYAFSDKNGLAIENGVISMDGGRGIDSLLVRGSESNDLVVVSKDGLLSSFGAVQVAGVETKDFDAAGGEDIFNVVGSSEKETIVLNGGNGSDTVVVGGGLTESEILRGSNNQGQNASLKYEIMDDEGLADDEKDRYDISAAGKTFEEKYSIINTSSVPSVFVSSSDTSILPVKAKYVTEGDENGVLAFYVGCSGDLKSGTVSVKLRAPKLTTSELQSGDAGILICYEDETGRTEYSDSCDIQFKTSGKSVKVYVRAISDGLCEGNLLKSITISSTWYKGDGSDPVNLEDSAKSASVIVKDSTDPSTKNKNLFSWSEVFKIDASTSEISLESIGSDFAKENIHAYYIDVDAEPELHFNTETEKWEVVGLSEGTLVVNYRSNKAQIDSSKIRIAYDNIESLDRVKLDEKIILSKTDYENPQKRKGANVDTSVYYELAGNMLVFFNSSTRQLVTLHGVLSVDSKMGPNIENDEVLEQHEDKCDFLTIKEHTHTLVEATKNASEATPEVFTYTEFTVEYNGTIADNKKMRIKITVEDALRSIGGDKSAEDLYLKYEDQEGDTVIVTLENGSTSSTIRLVAKCDTVNEEYGLVDAKSSGSGNKLDDVKGAIYAYGKGESIEVDYDNLVMLKYNHFVDKDGKVINSYNESSGTEEEESPAPMTDSDTDDLNSVDRIMVNNYDSDAAATSQLRSLDGRDLYYATRDYEGLYDLYKGIESSMLKQDYALRFTLRNPSTTTLLTYFGVSMSEFEFGEFNLGTGADKVVVSKTLHRDDGFQTFTVVNTGDGNDVSDDEITVNRYDSENDGQLVINAQGGKDKITATGSKITKDGMVVLGGAGADEIKVDSGVIAFGDKGNIQYKDGDTVVTELGYYGEDVGEHKAGDIIRTETGKLQTDGVVRGASSIASVMPSEGDADDITASGQNSVVIGGSGSDKITVTGEKNVVLGDNGVVNFHNEGSAESWRENNITTSLEKVQTINNSVGETDTINIAGSHNVVMGGNGGDKITIGESGKENGIDNVVLGDGGVAEFTQGVATTDNFMVNAAIKSVKTEDDSDGARDEIKIYGGLNTVMGGAGNDDITIGDEGKDEDHQNGNENVVLGDGGSYVVDKDNGEVTVKTSREEIDDAVVIHGGEDTIKIYGGQNTVMGGAEGDTIDIFGADNIVLGDGGESIREWNADNEVYDSIKSVMTTDDDNGGVDTVNIHGGKNAVMGGADGDTITIGDGKTSDGDENAEDDNENQNGNENVVLGDGGSYVVNKTTGEVTVKTSREEIDDTVVIHGGEDTIAIHGGQNTVMGGAEGDTIDIFGADNIVLGDGGESIREWNADNEVYDSIKSVMTTDDDNGGVDTINIHGGKNTVMGGADGDKINIGDESQDNGRENVVLGDGGSYVVDEENGEVTVQTSRDVDDEGNVVIHGGHDIIDIQGGQNTVMGGAEDDEIDIYGADNIVLGDGGIATREWNDNQKIFEDIKSVETTDDDNGGIDTINIYGGKNAVMGGFAGDIITIGEEDGNVSDHNIVLGDGGEYNNEASDSAYIKTQSDGIGGEDHITVYGGHNVAMGGFAGDEIEIHGGENVVLGDGGIANYNKNPKAETVNEFINSGLRDVATTSDGIGGHDDIDIFGDKNVVMSGADGDIIDIAGNDNVVVGDGGRYDIYEDYRTVKTKSEQDGGHDVIHTNDGKNIVMGGMDADEITTGDGNDIILGDGGFAKVDNDFNALFVTNENIDVGEDLGTAGADTIIAGNGDNVVFGGLGNDDITTGNGQDVVFGDNAYATFRGNANEAFEQVGDRQNVPDVYEEATLSFNFQGASQTGLNATDYVGAPEFESRNWNNISGSLAGTYGNDDREVVNMDNLDVTGEKSADETRTRASGVSVSYGGYESHRNTSTDNRINLQAYNLGLWNMQGDKNAKLMNSGLMTTAPNAQCGSKFEVAVDGLAQYFTSYKVVVYLDIPDSHSAYGSSVRKVSLFVGGSEEPYSAYYVNDAEGHNFDGSFVQATATSADTAEAANYVVFDVPAGAIADNFRVVIEEAYPNNAQNGKNLAGIAGIQVRGTLHRQDVAATTDIDFGGDDIIKTGLGDDIVVGGTGSDDITTFGDERYGIYDNDVVFGDNAKILLTDRDSDESTASTISTAESVAVTNIDTATYDDTINTGDGNDTVVGGIGADTINAGATEAAEAMLDGVKAASVNFTLENADASLKVGNGETAGVVADTAWCNMYVKNGELHDVDNYSSHSVKGINVTISSYQQNSGWWNEMYAGNYAMTHENSSELDGDTANSKLFNGYLASQQHDEIKLTLDSIDQFRAQSGLAAGDACDIYVYLGADNGDTDTYNYIYQVSLNNGEKRFLNDWTGYNFDGDYREATCDSYEDAMSALHEGSAVRMEIVGNYVVFRNFTGNRAEIRIRNVFTSSGQNPKNLPVINAVQVVAGAGKDAAAIGGDHDKDLAYGDDAKLVFDLDVPFDADVPNVSEYKNRVIEAKSVAIEHDAVTSISTNDTITTGKDRDVVVGGEGADDITMGAGDDIALGGSANLVLEHNNPLGVFTPNTEIALDQHTINTTQHQNYLDNDNANVWQFQSRLDQNLIQGIDTFVSNENDRKDTIDVGEGRNLTSQGSDSTAQLVVPKPVIVDDDGQEGSGEASTPTPPVVAPDDGTVVIDQEGTSTLVEIAAGETVEIVITDWDEGNQYYHPNVFLQLNCSDNTRHKLSVTWDGQQTDPTVYLQNYAEFDIPDVATVVGEHKIVLRITSRDSISLMATVAHR
ncbi:calcium-binding protein [Fibrobacter sp. UWR3]|uniref:calcium-binding protein n=1 Tax=Fibrobacter sp. UWR3 TaxID=1896217 RepID=UPI001160B967|nr:calcium-binding protein [Fibrobacter sp. UWR3]